MKTTNPSIEASLKTYLLEQFFKEYPDTLQADTPLVSSGVLDSISALELVDFIEETFEVEFLAHEVKEKNLESIHSLSKFIRSKQ